MFEVKYITNEIGEKTDVIMSFSDYLDILEEIDDLRVITERKNDILIEHSDVKTLLFHNE